MRQMAEQRYDQIGLGYADRRQPDPRLATDIHDALGDAESIVNVGAGTGSYEPSDRPLVAVEPSITMIRQRSKSAAPAVRAYAEELPFADGAFDASLAYSLFTIGPTGEPACARWFESHVAGSCCSRGIQRARTPGSTNIFRIWSIRTDFGFQVSPHSRRFLGRSR